MTATETKAEIRTSKSGPARGEAQPSSGPTVRVAKPEQLAEYKGVWNDLCGRTIVPNAFYEPWMVFPALAHTPDTKDLRFLLVFGPAGKAGVEPLWGFFPLEIQGRCMSVPVKNLAFWQHRWCYLATPLIDRERVWPVLDAFWRWFEQGQWGCQILDTNYLQADGAFHAIWADFALGRSTFLLGDFPRAFLAPAGTAASYLSNAMSKKHTDEYFRLERRLGELGKLEYRQVENQSEVDAWIERFLALEASGWKGGAEGRAFVKHAEDAAYFRTITQDGFVQGRVILTSLELNGTQIAMKHNLLAGDGSFAFRIAHDETYRKYSPGVLLEFDNIRRICAGSRTSWMDSCAAPRHLMANRIWSERRMIRRTLFSNGSRLGDFFISAFPLLRWLKKQVRPEAPAAYLEVSTKTNFSGAR